MKIYYCGLLNLSNLNKKIKLYGWVNNLRFLKNIVFIDLRDHTGIIQVFLKKKYLNLWKLVLSLTNESCIKILGKICKKKSNNSKIEVKMLNIKIYNYSKSLPLNINKKNSEKVRLKYRYLDLRRKEMFDILNLRSNVSFYIRKFFYKKFFLEIETPFLSKSFPEGARDYIIPSRIYKNKFYSLPQSPQIFKQLLMISCIDKYYQIVKCFRDEDSRSDRQPEFTQIDIELSFSNFKDIIYIIEELIINLWFNFKNIILNNNFPIISYYDSIDYYGTDKPDLRNSLKFSKDISNFLINKKIIKFDLFNLKTILIKDYYNNNNFNYNDMLIIFKKNKVLNYLCIKIISNNNNKYNYKKFGNININDNLINIILLKFKIKINNFIFILLFKKNVDFNNFTNIRNFFCNQFYKFKKGYYPIWINNFPMFYYDINNKINTYHHPFTMPLINNLNDLKILNNYSNLLSFSYDLVLNGYELGSGSKRIHDINIQREIFNILGINVNLQNKKYGFFLNSLDYGTPPHLGIALGFDRIIMLLIDNFNIKDVIAFPKTTSGICLLTSSPS